MQLKSNEQLCLTKSDPDFFRANRLLTAYSCVDAISMGDAREVFVLNFKNEVLTYIDNYCMTAGHNPQDVKKVYTLPC